MSDTLFPFLEHEMQKWGVPGLSYGVSKNGIIVECGGLGRRDLNQDIAPDAHTLYGIASCSKSFNACLLSMLDEEGLLSLDAPIRSYIPDFSLWDAKASEQCTLRDMLTHRTGLACHDVMWPDPGISKSELLHRLRYLRPAYPFRSQALYNNTVYSASSAIAEIVTGKSWEELIESRIFKPLGMHESMLSANRMYKTENHATGYWYGEGESIPHPVGPWEMDIAGGAAGVISNVCDMLKWLEFHAREGMVGDHRLLSQKHMRDLHTSQIGMTLFPYTQPEIDSNGGYGLAWFVQNYRNTPYIWHTGEIEGYCTIQAFFPAEDITVFVGLNTHRPHNKPILQEIVFTAYDKLTGHSDTDWVTRFADWPAHYEPDYFRAWEKLYNTSIPLQSSLPGDCISFCGIYESAGYGTYSISFEKGGLVLHYKDLTAPLLHQSGDTFVARGVKADTSLFDSELTFIRNAGNKICGFVLRLDPILSAEVFLRRDYHD